MDLLKAKYTNDLFSCLLLTNGHQFVSTIEMDLNKSWVRIIYEGMWKFTLLAYNVGRDVLRRHCSVAQR